MAPNQSIKKFGDTVPRQTEIHFDSETFSRELVYDIERSETAP